MFKFLRKKEKPAPADKRVMFTMSVAETGVKVVITTVRGVVYRSTTEDNSPAMVQHQISEARAWLANHIRREWETD